MLDQEQRRKLLAIARQSIEAALSGSRFRVDVDDEALRRPAGAFVTLNTAEGDLRGCIGSILPTAPLAEAVSASAVSAALRDPRFYPLRPEELPVISLEISVMGAIVPVEDVSEIVVGRDGLIIRCGANAGLLLPQVATDYGWDVETFLAQTCVKAGVAPDSWRRGRCRIERFPAEVFGEQDTHS